MTLVKIKKSFQVERIPAKFTLDYAPSTHLQTYKHWGSERVKIILAQWVFVMT